LERVLVSISLAVDNPQGSCIFSPMKYAVKGVPSSALYRYAEKAPGRTEMKPKMLSVLFAAIELIAASH
jgi:hypothetical protein